MSDKKRMGLGSRMQKLRQKSREYKKEQEKQDWGINEKVEKNEKEEKRYKNKIPVKEVKVNHGRNQWKTSKVLRTVIAIGMCIAFVTGAFSGVKMVGTARQMWNMDIQAFSSNDSLEKSENFNCLVDEYLQFFELYLDISQVIAPEGKLDYNTILLEGKDKSYTLEELYKAEGNGYDYRYYVDNYIENMLDNNKSCIDLLDLTKEIRSLKNMAVIHEGNVYVTSDMAKKLSQKEKKELLQKASDNTMKTLSEQKTLLPALYGEESDHVVKLSIPEKEAEIEAKSEYQEWIIDEYPEYAKGYMLVQIATAFQQGFKGDVNGVEAERYERIFKNLYQGECFLAHTYDFYEYQPEDDEILYYDFMGEEQELEPDQIVYTKKGKSVYAKDVQTELGDVEAVFSASQKMYAQQIKKEGKERLEELSEKDIPWSAPVLPYTLEEAQDYAHFLVEFYEEIQGVLRSSRFECYFESGNQIVKSDKEWEYLKRNIEKAQREEAEDKAEVKANELVYAYYNSNGSVFDTNFSNTYFHKSEECYEFLEGLGTNYGQSHNFICAFMVDLENIENAKEDEPFAKLYQIHQADQKIYNGLEEEAKQELIYFLISCAVILFAMLILSVMTGHEKGADTITLKWQDRIWLELVIIAFCCAVAGFFALCLEGTYWYCYSEPVREPEIFQAIVWGLAALAVIMAGMILTFIKRIKGKQFLNTSLICSNLFRLKRGMSKLGQGIKKWNEYIREFPILIRYVLVIGINIIGGLLGLWYVAVDAMGYSFFADLIVFLGVIGLIALDVYCIRLLMKNAMADEKIREGAERIAGGELSYQIEVPSGISKEQEELVKVINRIGEGLEKAVEESVRSERMKTELITNVSHDIKTPLTSVINYVDLLKREHIESERAQEYLRILEQKSQRLKVLIEDLVEASKASSGAMELQISKLNFNELVNQTDGEFEEKFQAAGLTMVSSISEEVIVFKGDGRRVYRILENLYGNVAKYAMPGTRVYTELHQKEDKAVFTIKNISKEPLNISPEELTERFVRGEQSRSTEGSGLGLSIAKSLTELMDGSFEIHMDGDLFRVTIRFPVI